MSSQFTWCDHACNSHYHSVLQSTDNNYKEKFDADHSRLWFKGLTEFALHRDKDTDISATSGQWICFGTSVSKSHYRLSE